MAQEDNSARSAKQKRQATRKSDEQQGVSRSTANARAWGAVNKLPGGGRKVDARHKLPSGPVGGSGRKTNLSRSS